MGIDGIEGEYLVRQEFVASAAAVMKADWVAGEGPNQGANLIGVFDIEGAVAHQGLDSIEGAGQGRGGL